METARETPINVPNTAKIAAVVWWILFIVFLAAIFSPFWLGLFGIEAGEWKFGVGFLCLIASATSFWVAIIYTKRSGTYSKILSGEGLLAHWTYTKEEWEKFAKKEHEETRRDKKNMFYLVTIISVIIGAIFIAADSKDWGIYLPTVAGIIVIAGLSALLAVYLSYRQNHKRTGEVYITRNALIINNVLHVWKGFALKLTDVDYKEYKRQIPVLIFSYIVPARYGIQNITVRVPVPKGHEEEAKSIAADIDSHMELVKPDLSKN